MLILEETAMFKKIDRLFCGTAYFRKFKVIYCYRDFLFVCNIFSALFGADTQVITTS